MISPRIASGLPVHKNGAAVPAGSGSGTRGTFSGFPSLTRVEMKGYKNIMKLPDWLMDGDTFVNSGKRYQNRYLCDGKSCPVPSVHKTGAYGSGAGPAGSLLQCPPAPAGGPARGIRSRSRQSMRGSCSSRSRFVHGEDGAGRFHPAGLPGSVQPPASGTVNRTRVGGTGGGRPLRQRQDRRTARDRAAGSLPGPAVSRIRDRARISLAGTPAPGTGTGFRSFSVYK